MTSPSSATPPPARLQLRGCAVYQGDLLALEAMDLTLAPSTSVALVGAAGSGIADLLRALAGLARHEGEISLDGEQVRFQSPGQALAAGIALCPADRGIFPRLTVRENLAVGGHTLPSALCQARVDEQLARFEGLARRRDTLAGQLSGGEQQQLAIARALMVHPRLLLLEEPSRGLSPAAIGIVLRTVAGLTGEGKTVLIADQSLDWLKGKVDRILIVSGGRITADSGKEEFSTNELAEAYFLLG